ncbi:MAG: ATP-binding protein [bacterium]
MDKSINQKEATPNQTKPEISVQNQIDTYKEKVDLLLEDISSLERYVRDLFIFAPIPICFITPRGIILEANPAFERIVGVSQTDIVGKDINNYLKESEIEKLQEETLERGFVEGRELTLLPKGGSKITVQASTRIREDEEGTSAGYFLSLFDLSKVKETENDIRQTQRAILNILEDTEESRRAAEEEKNKTQAIINSFTDGLLVFGIDSRLSSINPQAEVFLRVKESAVAGLSIANLKQVGGMMPVVEFLTNGKDVIKKLFREELEIQKGLVIEITTIQMERESERFGHLVILHDISREKMVERMKTEFVSIAAHQLRTPLSAIKWTLKILLDGDLGEVNPEQYNFIDKCYRSNERMIGLINDLLDVARIEDGRYVYQKVAFNIQEMIRAIVGVHKEGSIKKRVELIIRESEKPLPSVIGDQEKIKLVIQNFIDNAIKYTKSGGTVEIAEKSDKGKVIISFKDSGVGIPEDQKARVFTKFFRAANVMRMETEGSGLGLFIVKNIVSAHSGDTWFESEEGKGSTFYFSMPTVGSKIVDETQPAVKKDLHK